MSATDLLPTPLRSLHLELGARMVPFAGYEMPLQYPTGIVAEHRHCRESAALFDVSHMGQVRLLGDAADAALETLVPVDVIGLGINRQRYAFFTNAQGGILDDLMIVRREGDLFMVVNAACKADDIAWMKSQIGDRCEIQPLPDRALLALQGPKAGAVIESLDARAASMVFMTAGALSLAGIECFATRSGYTGEDGFEISVPTEQAAALARALLAHPEVKPAGLGARDILRLEAGLCLYGHDIDASTTPVEASLTWAIQKVRRPGGARAGGYPGAAAIERQLTHGTSRRRVGLIGAERMPVREGTVLHDAAGRSIGRVTSGTLTPSVNQAIAMGYVESGHAGLDTPIHAQVRGKRLPMQVAAMPFQPHRYHRG